MHSGSLLLLNVRESEVHFDVITCNINHRIVAIKFETKLLYDSDKYIHYIHTYISQLKEVIINNFLTHNTRLSNVKKIFESNESISINKYKDHQNTCNNLFSREKKSYRLVANFAFKCN